MIAVTHHAAHIFSSLSKFLVLQPMAAAAVERIAHPLCARIVTRQNDLTDRRFRGPQFALDLRALIGAIQIVGKIRKISPAALDGGGGVKPPLIAAVDSAVHDGEFQKWQRNLVNSRIARPIAETLDDFTFAQGGDL